DAASVALGTEEAGEAVGASDVQSRDALRDSPDRPCPDLQRDLARLAVLRDLGFVLQAQIQGRQSGGGVSHRAPLHQLRRENQSVHSALGGADAAIVLTPWPPAVAGPCGLLPFPPASS